MKRLWILVLMLFVLVPLAFADGIESVWPAGPTVMDVRTYAGSGFSSVTLTFSHFTPNSYIRVVKNADEPGLYGDRSRFTTDLVVLANNAGDVYLVDTSVKAGSRYTYTLIDVSGLQAIVPVTIPEVYLLQPYTVQCVSYLPTRFALGDEGRALFYQDGYTRATVDPLYSDVINIGLYKGDRFVVVNGPVCDGNSIWWQIYTIKNNRQDDQMMYMRESTGGSYWVEPTGSTQNDIPLNRVLPHSGQYWTPVSDRFGIVVRPLPTWCKQDGVEIAPEMHQAKAGELYPVRAITSDTSWVQIQLPDGRLGWVGTHFGNINFHVPYHAYGNMDGWFVFPPPYLDPVSVPPWQTCR